MRTHDGIAVELPMNVLDENTIVYIYTGIVSPSHLNSANHGGLSRATEPGKLQSQSSQGL